MLAATPIRIELTVANTGGGVSEATTIRCRLPVGVELVSVSEEGAIEDDDPSELIEGLRGIELHYLRGPHKTEDPEDETEIRRSA